MIQADVGVTLYARIASVLRTKIATGTWPIGHMIPTIDELCDEYGAAKITVRQAIKVLSDEGLLQSQRGKRTFVSGAPRDFPDSKIARIIEARGEHQERFKSLERTTVKSIPPLLSYGSNTSAGLFKFIRRLHVSGNRSLFLIDLFIDKALSEKLTRRQENIVSVVRLLNAGKSEVEVETTVTIGSADAEMARFLECPFASPIAQVVRLVVTADGRVMLASRATYPGELFAMQTAQSGLAFLKSRRGSSVRNSE